MVFLPKLLTKLFLTYLAERIKIKISIYEEAQQRVLFQHPLLLSRILAEGLILILLWPKSSLEKLGEGAL